MSSMRDLGAAYTHYATETKRGFLSHNNNSGMNGGDVSGPEGQPDCRIDLWDFQVIAGN